MIGKYIDLRCFFIALCMGLLLVYLLQPEPTIIIKCPTPDNEDKVKYIDKAGNCFKYKSNEVECPSNKSDIKSCP